jgi:hypothetical protein
MMSGAWSRILKFPTYIAMVTVILAFPATNLLYGQQQVQQFDLRPLDASDADVVTFKIGGVWPDGCVPQSPVISISPGTVRIDTSNPAVVCPAALTPWTLSGTIGKLQAGRYDVIVRFSGAPGTNPVELGRRSLTVADSSLLSELIFPMVVNGSVAEKQHYQTIFTVLNTSAAEVKATLQVYSNAAAAPGAFCSPLAPPPSGAQLTLTPNSEYLQFTSPDLPFLNGWARLRWTGSAPILVSEELTLVAAAPAPCLLVCNRPSSEKLSSAQITAVRPGLEFRMPMTINPNRQTAVALINPSSSAAVTVKVSILDSSGQAAKLEVPSSFEVKVGPLERISKFVWQMAAESSTTAAPNLPDSFQGSLIFSSDSPFVASGLHIMFPEGKFVPVPAVSTR